MRDLYTISLLILTLLCIPLLSFAQSSQQATNFLVKLNREDPENKYNPRFHLTKLRLLEFSQVKSHTFVEERNAFIVKADSPISIEALNQKVSEFATATPITEQEYQRLLKQQVSYKLSKNRELNKVELSNFPKYKSTGNVAEDQANFRNAIEKWIDSHPSEYQKLF